MSFRSAVVGIVLVAGLFCGCGSATEGVPDRPVERYHVRGMIVELPDPDVPGSKLRIHHEAIDDFRGVDGEIWGMDSMTMPFDVTADGLTDGLSKGDEVEFTLEVRWGRDASQTVTEIRPLPPGTTLEFRKALPSNPTE